MPTPVVIDATSTAALAYAPPSGWPTPSDKHIARALDQLNDELRLSEEDVAAQLDLIERVESRSRELALAEREAFTRRESNRFAGIAIDACALLQELQTLIASLDFFSAGDTGLGNLCQAATRINTVLARLHKEQQ